MRKRIPVEDLATTLRVVVKLRDEINMWACNNGYSVREAARRLDVSFATYHRYIIMNKNLYIDTLVKILLAYCRARLEQSPGAVDSPPTPSPAAQDG